MSIKQDGAPTHCGHCNVTHLHQNYVQNDVILETLITKDVSVLSSYNGPQLSVKILCTGP